MWPKVHSDTRPPSRCSVLANNFRTLATSALATSAPAYGSRRVRPPTRPGAPACPGADPVRHRAQAKCPPA